MRITLCESGSPNCLLIPVLGEGPCQLFAMLAYRGRGSSLFGGGGCGKKVVAKAHAHLRSRARTITERSEPLNLNFAGETSLLVDSAELVFDGAACCQ